MTHPKTEPPFDSQQMVIKMAKLARLELTPAEVSAFSPQLSGVIEYINQLSEVEVAGIEPMTHPLELKTALREDIVVPTQRDAEGRSKVLSSAPEVLFDGFKVPPIL